MHGSLQFFALGCSARVRLKTPVKYIQHTFNIFLKWVQNRPKWVQNTSKMSLKCHIGTPWRPFRPYLAYNTEKERKKTEKELQIGAFWGPFFSHEVLRGSILRHQGAQRGTKRLKVAILWHSENVCFPMCFCMFLRLGGTQWSSKWSPREAQGNNFGPIMWLWAYMFAFLLRFIFNVDFRSIFSGTLGLFWRGLRQRRTP